MRKYPTCFVKDATMLKESELKKIQGKIDYQFTDKRVSVKWIPPDIQKRSAVQWKSSRTTMKKRYQEKEKQKHILPMEDFDE